MQRRGSTQDDVRRHNLRAILGEVHRYGHRSRAQLTADLGLNRSTIGALVGELIAAGLVMERSSRAEGRAGRPSLEVVPSQEGPYVLAVDLGVRRLRVARAGLGGDLSGRTDVRTPGDWGDVDRTVDYIADACAGILRAAPDGAQCVGVGVGVPGVVRRTDGLLRFAPNLGWVDLPLGERLSERLGLPVTIANDADLAALAEHRRGAAVGYDNVIVMSGEIGIGGGIIVAGRPLRGRGGYAGEIGHLRVNPSGRACQCGSWGCLETEIGVDALLRAAGRPVSAGMNAYREILALAAAGEGPEAEAADGLARWLGVGVGMLVNVFDPDIVVLSGPLSELFAVTERKVREAYVAASMVALRTQVRLAASDLGTDAQLAGAAELALTPLLSDPLATMAAR